MRRFLPFVLTVLAFWLCFLVHSCISGPSIRPAPWEATEERPPAVQVGLSAFYRIPKGDFAVRGPCRVGGREYGDGIEAHVEAAESGIWFNNEIVTEAGLRVEVFEDGTLELPSGSSDAGGRNWRRYRGHLWIVKDQGKLTFINEVDLERYLAGVLGREMSLQRKREALRAQAIAARTYALYETQSGNLRKVRGEKFDLFDDTRSQVYGGVDAETPLAWDVIRDTWGAFVLWEGRFVPTFYSSTCGGRTDAAWSILSRGQGFPSLAGVECGHCLASPYYEWETKLDREAMAVKIFPDEPQLKVQSIRIVKRWSEGGHVGRVGVQLVGHEKERVLHADTDFRRPLGLRSTLWTDLREEGDQILIRGRGWGHGAGMCQWGAYAMADQGRRAEEILQYYFPGSEVRKMY